MKKLKESLLALGTAGLLACAGIAQANLLVNGSFEDTTGTFVGDGQKVMNLAPGSTLIPGWTADSANSISWLHQDNPFGLTTPSGQLFLDLTGATDTAFGYIEQTFATTTGGVYHLSFEMAANNSCPGFDCSGPMTMRVNVAGVVHDFTGFDPAGPGMHWGTFGTDFTAISASTTLRLTAALVAGGSSQFRGLDNAAVELVSLPVPEPETYAMMLVGLAFVGFVAGRRRLAVLLHR